ncbi:MAG: hypothetical protein ARM1_0237 [Candidatus Micrarchaeota archaeon]|nr:MAG: hypothetical protein ARM1_0237 [Candidatus Micrarchaeota archaeon]
MHYRYIFIVLLISLADTTYLTIAHYDSGITLYCPDKGIINCNYVTSSVYSEILGIPIALLGLIWSIVSIVLAYMSYKTILDIRYIRIMSLFGLAALIYSVAAMSLLGKICLYCSLLDIMLLSFFILVFFIP